MKYLFLGHEEDKILLYCTGGIRCEKVAAYLVHKGFKDVNKLQGGINNFAKYLENGNNQLIFHNSPFKGRNFVFDNRIKANTGHHLSEEIVGKVQYR
jgi:UPF0176 protein